MIVGVPRESYPHERRVALVPASIPALTKAGFEIAVETGAGDAAGYRDSTYAEKGAKIQASRAEIYQTADIVVQVLCPGANDITGKDDLALLRKDQILIGFLRPLGSAYTVQLAQTGVTSFAVELVPRTTRAQSMDALSVFANIVGYRAVIEAAAQFGMSGARPSAGLPYRPLPRSHAAATRSKRGRYCTSTLRFTCSAIATAAARSCTNG